ncbi:hypothetical protein JCM10450v2_005317 [Rhodotorula kratochvilovae]
MASRALPRPITQALGALRAAWREIGGDAGRLTAWTRVVSKFLNAHASTWDPAVVNAVADELDNYASMIQGGMLMEDFNEGQTGRDDERGTFNRRDRSPRGRYTPEAEEHSLAKGASGPPHYKLQRLRPF